MRKPFIALAAAASLTAATIPALQAQVFPPVLARPPAPAAIAPAPTAEAAAIETLRRLLGERGVGHEVAAPAPVVASPAPTFAPIDGYAVESPQGHEWRVGSAMDGYAIVEGPFGYEVIARDATSAPPIGGLVAVRLSSGDLTGATFRLVAPEDGYYDEGRQGYEWRLRLGR